MAKARKTAKRTTSRKPARGASRARRASTKSGFMAGMLDFTPPAWLKDIMSSQTSRVIMAEALVAAAGAAAAVIAASRTETGRKAGEALADGGAVMKDAAISAAAAARDVIGKSATAAIGSAASTLLGDSGDTQKDYSQKAMRMRDDSEKNMPGGSMAENARRHRGPERSH